MKTRLPSKHITFQKHPIALKDPFQTGRQWCALCTVHNRNMEKIKKDAALMRTITHQRSFTSYQQSNSRGGNMECLMDRHESTSQHGSEATYEKRGGAAAYWASSDALRLAKVWQSNDGRHHGPLHS